jgi:hypothetical protein
MTCVPKAQRPVPVADPHPASVVDEDVVVPQIQMYDGGTGTPCQRLAGQHGHLLQPLTGTVAFDHSGHPNLDVAELVGKDLKVQPVLCLRQ